MINAKLWSWIFGTKGFIRILKLLATDSQIFLILLDKISESVAKKIMNKQEIISKLPYSKPFLFVDELFHIDENGAEGCYTFDENLDFYKGHFKDNPVTPGVILTEVMAQIGLVCLGIYLQNDTLHPTKSIALTSTEIEFLKPVFPKEKVVISSEKIYFRFGKLKCKVLMKNNKDEMVCSGTISGMIV